MKALFEKIELDEQASLQVKHLHLPYFDSPWHYHPEFELTYILNSQGRRFVGDHVEAFEPGDLVLLGPNLPHFWRNDEEIITADDEAEAVVVQFAQSLGEAWLPQLPEAGMLRTLLVRAGHGLRFCRKTASRLHSHLLELTTLTGFDRLLALLHILKELAADPGAVMLASEGYQLKATEAETERMKRVLDYMLAHFREEIRVEDISSVAGMAPAAFCRYFRKRTRKSFIEYLNELRISYARKLLSKADVSVSQVGMECGFNNISHFHRQFKLRTGTTPLRFQSLQKGL
ncbi:AraC family transcriptional regulator [Tellurirhabdus rosea]|uniref:AraC family transcriptional regulator n=1 Tax=Tellurirhabdus rosea TaxID=2674997 RepID=UPI00224C87C0|nr:AraC family transcriptional regulator [Tellurirhabdus rosea]